MSMSQTAEQRTDKSESERSTSTTSSHQSPVDSRVEPTHHSRLQITVSKLQSTLRACVRACVCVCIESRAGGGETHAVLTAVGELHSLTDWQVSEASEEAELVDFWERGGDEMNQ